ncbi:DUF3800 domain-containing protein [Tissierella sp. MB52-C2]|uniref:DUF3800 domain-containing protein n=1 Tax=Tissierella sp. MB52-C2 TaxID=3070999 RepID=UPI00280B6046|nr:DUF3800 domain-containing protein [Tissierella sp. MB52-C2]WMM24090.1 DUF3800 domain-containing protein [Tissierella sp. MB52-C2]
MDSDIEIQMKSLDYYDYFAYVDASGDDGFKFEEYGQGSSRCYAVAMFVVKKDDIEYNIDKLNKIKKLVGCKPEHEAKYTTLRRHRNKDEVHKIVSELKGTLVSWIAFKEKIEDPYFLDIKNKALSQLCHVFPIKTAHDVLKDEVGSNLFIAVDVMKKVEMDGLKELLEDNFMPSSNESNKPINNYNLKFKDSKDKDFQLIQVADILAGIIRNSFESWPFDHEIWKRCKICDSLVNTKKLKNLCKYKNKGIHLENSNNLFKILPLFLKDEDHHQVVLSGICPFPLELYNDMSFVDCLLNKDYKLGKINPRIRKKQKNN